MEVILEINEDNYLQKREEGSIELERKFSGFDELKNLKIPIEESNLRLSILFRDPSIWAYAFLKDKENKRLRVYPWQDAILNDKHRFLHITAANQIGKTWTACIKALHHALHVNNASVMIISKTEDQAKAVLDEIKWMMRRSNLDFKDMTDEVENRFEIHFKSPDGKGVSVIRVFPPTKRILGYPATLVIMDETGFWEKQEDLDSIKFYYQCIEPRTNTTRNWNHPFLIMGQIMSITNPNGQQGLAWHLFDIEKRFGKYIINFLAKPENTKEHYEEARINNPTDVFESAYAAVYSSLTGGFITAQQLERFESHNIPLIVPPNSILYLGGDFAGEDVKSRGRDYTVLYGVILEENLILPKLPIVKVVYMKEFKPKTKKTIIYKEITLLKNNLSKINTSIAKFAYDKAGVGDSVKNDLIDRAIFLPNQIESLTYSLENKSEVYYNMLHLFEHDLIHGSRILELRRQIMGLKVDKPENSPHIKVHHKTEGIHDDHPDALANACYIAKRFGYIPAGLTIIYPQKLAQDIIVINDDKQQSWIPCRGCDNYFYLKFNHKEELRNVLKNGAYCERCIG